MVESLDGIVNVILTDGFFWDGDEFQAKAKDGQCGCRDNLLGHVVMKLLVGEMGKIDPVGVLPST
jgi:hypothetical protein